MISLTPNAVGRVSAFFNDLRIIQVYPHVFLPAPQSAHPVLYKAAFQYCIGWGIVQIGFLAARIVVRDWPDRVALSISSIIFWFGFGYLLNLLIGGILSAPMAFGYFIVLSGIVVVIRGLGFLVARNR